MAGLTIMSVSNNRIFSLTIAVLTCAFLTASGVVCANDNTPRIHPKRIELLHGTVTGKRIVPAYAAALGAWTNQFGELYCPGFNQKIKDSAIFRVQTASRYFDLLKWCNGYGPIRSWGHWEQLTVGEKVVFRVVKESAQLSIPRCENLGLLSKAQAQLAVDFLSVKGQKIYKSHCKYSITEAYVKVPDERWIFRIVDSGPRSQTKNRRIGASYSPSLPPPW